MRASALAEMPLVHDDLETGLTPRACRTDAAANTSSPVLSPGMCWVLDHSALVANPIKVRHQVSVLDGFCFHEPNGWVLKLARIISFDSDNWLSKVSWNMQVCTRVAWVFLSCAVQILDDRFTPNARGSC